MADFNSDNEKIDAALTSLSGNVTVLSESGAEMQKELTTLSENKAERKMNKLVVN